MIRRNYKDSLFTKLFGDPANKQNLLSLYNALNDRNYTDPDELEINTIENVIYMGVKNDVSCIIDGYMNLMEHQGSFNPNMPLRGFIYIPKLYEKYIDKHQLNIYSEKLIKIPTPRYFVLYNGIKEMPERLEMKLSDAFIHPDGDCGIEFTATMINVNYGHNKELMTACRMLEEYAIFIDKVRGYIKPNMEPAELEKAMDRAVDECLEEGVLAEFLSAHRAEVRNMILTEYDEAKTMEMFKKEFREDGIAIGLEKGRREGEKSGEERGRREEKIMVASRMKARGAADEEIADILGMTLEQLQSILSADKVHE